MWQVLCRSDAVSMAGKISDKEGGILVHALLESYVQGL